MFEIELFMYIKMNFELNNLQWLICHKTKPNQSIGQIYLLENYSYPMKILVSCENYSYPVKNIRILWKIICILWKLFISYEIIRILLDCVKKNVEETIHNKKFKHTRTVKVIQHKITLDGLKCRYNLLFKT